MSIIEFHFDFGSPNAYLAHRVIPALEARHDIRFEYVPILLGGVFKETGNVSPAESLAGIRNKGEYQAIETRRFCAAHGISPQVPNPHFPVNTLKIMRGATFARDQACYNDYIEVMYQAMWERALKLDEDGVLEQVLTEAGLPTEEILEGMADPAVKQRLIDSTRDTVARGTFGSPTFYAGAEIFFGKDKLRDAVEFATR